ncbi:MAG TPA: D-alanyl-D-alanine carboxypeptidase family protein [Actinomycetota bacterium]
MSRRIGHRHAAIAAALVSVLVTVAGSVAADPGPDVPPPTPVPPRGSPSPFPTVLATPAEALAPPPISARGALLADLETGEILLERAADGPRPIASLTKIMTALVVRERADLGDIVVVSPDAVFGPRDFGAGSTLGLRAGERIRVEDLLYGMLLGSANDAAAALAIHVAGSEEAFVQLMNRRAARLGMRRTRFASVHGLDDRGRSTPRDLLRLIGAATADPTFNRITAARFRTIPGPGPDDRRIQNRNVLVWLYDGAFGAKTGTTAGAGPCVIATAVRDGRSLVSIVLHAAGEPFSDAASLLNYGFEGFTETTVVRAGTPLGQVRIRGGRVETAAGGDLLASVPTTALDRIRAEILVDPAAVFPPAPGQRIGSVRYVTEEPASVLGSVPLVVASVPPPAPEERPWWLRALGAVGDAVRDAVAGLAS